MRDILYQFNPWWEREFHSGTMPREQYLSELASGMDLRDIVFITGLRRVGKTTLMHQFIEMLLEKSRPETILYVSLEHPLFANASIMEILREYRTIHGLDRDEKVYLFFDEVHMKEGFETELKVLYDMEKAKIYASGSSSLALRHEGSFLTGRYSRMCVEPFSFEEFLRFKGVEIRQSELYMYETYLMEYMKTGGMPEYLIRKDPKYLLEILESIVYKDIVARYGLRNPKAIKTLLLLLAERVGKNTTYNKLSKVLGVTPDTVKQYVAYFEDAFLIYQVSKCARSLNERIYAPKKLYFADVGMRNVLTGFKDTGAVAENLVFLKLRSQQEKQGMGMDGICYSHVGGKEIDFILGDTAVEVKYRGGIEAGELKALMEHKAKKKILVSKEKEEFENVETVPLSEFLRE